MAGQPGAQIRYHPEGVYYSTSGELPQDNRALAERLTRFFYAQNHITGKAGNQPPVDRKRG